MKLFAIGGAAAAAWLCASAACATSEVATFSGTVSNSENYTGEFGSPGSLNGDSFVLTYTFDTDVGARTTTGAKDILLSGASNLEPISVAATLEIAGVTQVFAGEYYGLALAQAGYLQLEAEDCAETDTPCAYLNNYVTMFAYPPGSPPSLAATFPPSSVSGVGEFSLVNYNPEGETYFHYAYGELDATTATLSSGVPEPATWAMMLAGFGALGGAVRGRRRRPGVRTA